MKKASSSMNVGLGEKNDKTMKKRLIYTMTFLLCGTFLFSSCKDMLQIDSDRVDYELDKLTFNDSVYSVLGILKSVQNVGDRQVLINELRGDLVTVNESKAVVDVQELARFEFNTETNKYLAAKDYYSIINNCNIYLARVDTTLEKNNIRLMLPEYVAVKSVRAWTYLQLAINYNEVLYFTEPILTHSASEEILNGDKLTRDEIIGKLIAELLPYENPAAYPMPAWDTDGKVLTFGYGSNGTEVETKRLFVPIRMLLGELYLWRGDYKNAAHYFYAQIAGTGTNETAKKYNDHGFAAKYSGIGGKNMDNRFMNLFSAKNFDSNSSNIFTIIPFANSDLQGTTSDLASVFSPQGEVGAAQVSASPGILSLAKRQVYRYYEGEDPEEPTVVEYSQNYNYPGDLRVKATTYSQQGTDNARTEYDNIIGKFNFEDGTPGFNFTHTPNIRTTFIILQRKEHAYLRLAEALVGLEREGYIGAMDLAMAILKIGVKKNYQLLQNPVYANDSIFVNDTIFSNDSTLVNDTILEITTDTLINTYLASCTDSLRFNFTAEAFRENLGIHSRGCGDSERNIYYSLTDTCIARYLGLTEVENKVETIQRTITYDDSLNYIADLVIDELALEFAWEGTRFGDLIRFAEAAKRAGDPQYYDILAKRVAGRAYDNDVTYRSAGYQYDTDLYGKLSNEANWYLPLPGEAVEPVAPEDIPTGELPNK